MLRALSSDAPVGMEICILLISPETFTTHWALDPKRRFALMPTRR